MSHDVKFIPNPLQRGFIESQAKADLFSSRMGEGKSTALAWSALYHTRHNPGASWAIIRDTWENIQATTMKTFFEWFPPGIFGTFHATKKEFTWASGVASGTVQFLGMDDPQDASKLMSRELAGIGIDEPAPAIGSVGVDEMIFDIGLSRLRQPNMHWYSMKLAENNPDESHWTYRRFVEQRDEGFEIWQPSKPENELNLPPTYYQELRRIWQHRPDLIRRFVDGEFGFQSIGKSVTPQFNDKYHLATGLIALPRTELILLWDWGHNPTCIITQKTPLGSWNILDSVVGDGIGAEELINDAVKPMLLEKYPKMQLMHIGDPAGTQREQTSIHRTAVRVMLKALGGKWRSGPVRLEERIEPLRSALGRQGLIKVDRNNAKEVWHALRGGWHFHITRTGITSGDPVKNIHSHPGDAMSYGAGVLFPLGKIGARRPGDTHLPYGANYFGSGNPVAPPRPSSQIGPGRPHMQYPSQGQKLG